MRRLFLIVLLALGVVGGRQQSTAAQSSGAPQPGDPPVLARISVSSANANGMVTINGEEGAVFANATVYIRNLYTGATVSARAGSTGKFSAELYGPGNTPFWISPSSVLAPADLSGMTGSLPGGPGAIFYGATPSTEQFTLSGQFLTAGGELASWSAVGRTVRWNWQRAGWWQVQLDVTLQAELPDDAAIIGAFSLQPIARSVGGDVIAVGGAGSNNGWSSILTPSGMPIDNLNSSVALGEVAARPSDLIHEAGDTRFLLDFSATLPRRSAAGLYVPFFTALRRRRRRAGGVEQRTASRLPLVVSVGGVHDARLPLALFYDDPSDGSRGVLPDEDQGSLARSPTGCASTARPTSCRPSTPEPVSRSLIRWNPICRT